jgi:hypothetical protein
MFMPYPYSEQSRVWWSVYHSLEFLLFIKLHFTDIYMPKATKWLDWIEDEQAQLRKEEQELKELTSVRP